MLPRISISTLFPYTTLFRSFEPERSCEDQFFAHDILGRWRRWHRRAFDRDTATGERAVHPCHDRRRGGDRKSTRLNSSHGYISYAVFCLKKKKKKKNKITSI